MWFDLTLARRQDDSVDVGPTLGQRWAKVRTSYENATPTELTGYQKIARNSDDKNMMVGFLWPWLYLIGI